MEILIVYLIGFFISYYWLKYINGPHSDWGDFWLTFLISLFSIIMVIFLIYHYSEIKLPKKPPKWL